MIYETMLATFVDRANHHNRPEATRKNMDPVDLESYPPRFRVCLSDMHAVSKLNSHMSSSRARAPYCLLGILHIPLDDSLVGGKLGSPKTQGMNSLDTCRCLSRSSVVLDVDGTCPTSTVTSYSPS